MALELISIINYFHNQLNTSIRNLSTHNIFLIGNKLKLNIINLKRIIQECSLENNRRREGLYYEYLPPDVFHVEENNEESCFTKEGNIWSLGTIISEIFSNTIPWVNKYKNKNDIIIIKLLVNKKPFPIPETIKSTNSCIYDLIEKCCNIIPNQRPDINQIQKNFLLLFKAKENIFHLLSCMTSNYGNINNLKKKYILVKIGQHL